MLVQVSLIQVYTGCEEKQKTNLNLLLDSTKAHFIRCILILPSIRVKDFDITDERVVI